MGYFKTLDLVLKNFYNSLPRARKTFVGLEIELIGGLKTTIKSWFYNRDSKVVLTLTNGITLPLEELHYAEIEKIIDYIN